MSEYCDLIHGLLSLRTLSGAERESLEAMECLLPELGRKRVRRMREIEANHRSEINTFAPGIPPQPPTLCVDTERRTGVGSDEQTGADTLPTNLL